MTVPGPTPQQYAWHERERAMLLSLDPATWQGRELDDHSTPLSAIRPDRLDVDQWCEAALLWGAGMIIMVAKHTGGFCWWQTQTSTYGVKELEWRNGRADVVGELAQACRRHGLAFGIYLSPADETFDAFVGGGGRTNAPENQAAYNEVYRTQLTELLSRYGDVAEVWFDGGLAIPVTEILERHAPDAMVFQGPDATIRWSGTERGEIPAPGWSTVHSRHFRSGVSTAYHSHPEGDVWAPIECDTTLYDHHWFWSPEKETKRKPLEELVRVYYKSVGRGGVLLLAATPDTGGLIPAGDMELYRGFGREIARRFDTPVASASGSGVVIQIDLDPPALINHALIMESYELGERVREYRLEVLDDSGWAEVAAGTAVGRTRIEVFPTVRARAARLVITSAIGTPTIRSLSLHHVDGTDVQALIDDLRVVSEIPDTLWATCAEATGVPSGDWQPVRIDLSRHMALPGQYEVRFVGRESDVEVRDERLELAGVPVDGLATRSDRGTFLINRTAMVDDSADSAVLCCEIRLPAGEDWTASIRPL